MDDLLLDIEFVSFTGGLIGLVCWNGFFFAWMLVLALYYQNWNESELRADVSRPDAYWFGFSSLTTLGLAEFTVQPEVLEPSSFILYTLLFLIGICSCRAPLPRWSCFSRPTAPNRIRDKRSWPTEDGSSDTHQ
jgi:4-amino-4-deoxy-L-arabinose transferase-like glycosyltransferase